MKTKIPSLTGLRAIAALWVFMFHCGENVDAGWPLALRQIVSGGFTGVDLFFVLSGFILSWNYLGPEGIIGGNRHFWRARAARILPVYYGALALSLPVFLGLQFSRGFTPGAIRETVVTAVANATLTQSWIEPLAYRWNVPGWSLSVEAFLYCAFPFLAVWLARNSAKRILWVTAICYGVTMLGAAAHTLVHPDFNWDLALPANIAGSFWGNSPVSHFHEFLMGSATFVWLREEQSGARKEWLSGPKAVWIAVGAITALLVVHPPVPFTAALTGAYSPLFALLIYGLAKQQDVVSRVLSTRPLQFLGEISFALYLTHHTVWDNVALFQMQHPEIHWSYLSSFLICLGISLAVATVFYRWIEIPYQRVLLKKRGAGREAVRRLDGLPAS